MRHKPQQQRSVASTERMLLAAEELLHEGGGAAVTVDAVIARAQTSTGAFYARFGDRQGLLEAVHERFLTSFTAELAAIAKQVDDSKSFDTALTVFVKGLFAGVRQHRNTFAFYMLYNAHDPTMREQGNAATRSLTALVHGVMARSFEDADPVAVRDTADFTARILMGLSLDILHFEPHEITGNAITDAHFDDETLQVLTAYVTARLATG
jgi:AcrR family transcriptional regulator